jgi:hypothetical protein
MPIFRLLNRITQRAFGGSWRRTTTVLSWRHVPWIVPLSDAAEDHATALDLADDSLIKVTDH